MDDLYPCPPMRRCKWLKSTGGCDNIGGYMVDCSKCPDYEEGPLPWNFLDEIIRWKGQLYDDDE